MSEKHFYSSLISSNNISHHLTVSSNETIAMYILKSPQNLDRKSSSLAPEPMMERPILVPNICAMNSKNSSSISASSYDIDDVKPLNLDNENYVVIFYSGYVRGGVCIIS